MRMGSLGRYFLAPLAAVVLALSLLHAAAANSPSPPVTPDDQITAIRQVVEQQLAAMQRGDAEGAFAMASPSMRKLFGTAPSFMETVRTGYRPVYRHTLAKFIDLIEMQGQMVQRVLLIDPDGSAVTALYIMQRQPNGEWRINGCVLVSAPDRNA